MSENERTKRVIRWNIIIVEDESVINISLQGKWPKNYLFSLGKYKMGQNTLLPLEQTHGTTHSPK